MEKSRNSRGEKKNQKEKKCKIRKVKTGEIL